MNFEELNLAPAIMQAVRELGYENPTPIQAQAIPAVLAGQDLLAGVCEIGDAGFGTFDSPILRDGSLVTDNLNRVTDANGGVGARLCQPILDKILESVPDANLTLAHVDKFLRDYATGKGGVDPANIKPWSAEAATVVVLGKSLKLKAVFDHHIKNYATWMWQSKITPAIRRNTDVYLADGGGWLYTIDSIRTWADGKIVLLTPDDVDHLKKYNYFELNGTVCPCDANISTSLGLTFHAFKTSKMIAACVRAI